jgi:hypothetical protein
MSRDNRERWTFFNSPGRPALPAEDVRYWKSHLLKILKVGFEFEFNLPEKNGTCKGDNNACPCRFIKTENCWQECVRQEVCAEKHAEARREFVCHGLACSGFISACVTCKRFEIDCNSCEHRFDPKKNPDAIRERMSRELKPSNSYGNLTKFGVHSITTDGSLLGKKGAEIITSGRRPDFWEYFKMAKKIIDLAIDSAAYVNERCSIHAHLLAAYYGKVAGEQNAGSMPNPVNELEKDMPEIILANFHQLCRRYQNAITWMTMGLDESAHMTRWEKFRVSVLEVSPATSNMLYVKDEVAKIAGGNKYGWVNYMNNAFADNGDTKRFHVEMRVMDALMTPSAVAAMGCLYVAMIIKAVEISRYGLLNVGDNDWLKNTLEVKNAMLNNMKGYQDGDRFADTRSLSKYFDILTRDSFELIAQMKHILIKIGPCYDILEKLAERPCALRRIAGQNWVEIEKDLAVTMPQETAFEARLSELIDMHAVDQCADKGEWVSEIARILSEDPEVRKMDLGGLTIVDRIQDYIMSKEQDGELVWLEKVGTVALI